MAGLLVHLSVATLCLRSTALAIPSNVRRAVTPVVVSTTSYGSLNAQGLSRDSLQLWMCRDTEQIASNGEAVLPVVANTASFSGLPSAPSSPQMLVLTSPQGFGSLFYPLESDECPSSGEYSDGTRWVGWPNTAPVVTVRGTTGQQRVRIYCAGPPQRAHDSQYAELHDVSPPLAEFGPHSYYELGRVVVLVYNSDRVWIRCVVNNGYVNFILTRPPTEYTAYLYGATPNGKLAIARAALTDFLGALDDKTLYEYYVNGGTLVPVNLLNLLTKFQQYGLPPPYDDDRPQTWMRTIQNAEGYDVYDQPLVRVDWE
ncbi:hypothetical protein B0H11DRAFT_1919476 [Mycena galericulata]|nr:hypothetical protein B0H11DRAFT_1919476 [Mycena galericulata]